MGSFLSVDVASSIPQVSGKALRPDLPADLSLPFPQHSSHTLSTAHASRTHIKAPQTDFSVKPDNSSGSTHDSPSERPLRKKATFQHGKTPKSIEESRGSTKQREDRPSRAPTDSPLCPLPIWYRDQGPKGNTEVKPVSSSLLRAMEGALKTSGQTPWLHAVASKPSRLGSHRSRLPIPLGWDWLPPDARGSPREPSYLRVSLEYPPIVSL